MALNQAEKMAMKCLPMAKRKLAQAGKASSHQSIRPASASAVISGQKRHHEGLAGRESEDVIKIYFGLIYRKLNLMGPTCRRARVTRSSRSLRQYRLHTHNAI